MLTPVLNTSENRENQLRLLTCKEGLKGVQQGCTGVTQTLGLRFLELGGQQEGFEGAGGTEDATAQPAVVPGASQCPACSAVACANSLFFRPTQQAFDAFSRTAMSH